MSTTTFSTLTICIWLGAVAWQDLRTRQVTNWLTLTPLLLAVILCAARSNLLPLALLAVIVVIDPLPQLLRAGMMLTACTLAAHFDPAPAPARAIVPATWAAAYSLAQLNMLGEADAKVAMTLTALFPSPVLAWCMVGVVLVISLAVTLWKYRLVTPLVLMNRVRDVLALQFPEPAEMEQGVPVAGAFLLAFIAYTVYGAIIQ